MTKSLHHIPICLTTADLLRVLHHNRQRATPPLLMAAVEEVLAISQALVVPAAVYDEFLVREVAGEQVILSADSSRESHAVRLGRLTVGPQVGLLSPAKRIVVAVYTIGPALEHRVRELHQAGKALLSFVLDSAGVLALDLVGAALREHAEKRASELGWGVGPALSPGSLGGWPVQGQHEVCALLPLDEIGVCLNEYSVLEPRKSVSVVVGMGTDYPAVHVGSMCRYCSLADSCRQRREDNDTIAVRSTGIADRAPIH